MLVKCGCGDKNCKIGLRFEEPNLLWLVYEDGKEVVMYLTPNIASDIAKELHDLYLTMFTFVY
jgi:hypothetical protein